MGGASAIDATPAAIGRELYVYYKVRGDSAAAALTVVREFQQELRAETPALVVRLLRHPGETDGLQTWMETYAVEAFGRNADVPPAAGIDAELQARIERAAARLAPHLAGARHVEVFVPFDRLR
jgi:hypothetical protein